MNTLPEWWTVPYPEVISPETATAYLDALGGALNRTQDNGTWVLSTGQQELIRSESPSELDSFVLGFALAHVICERHGPIGRRQPAAAAETAAPPAQSAPADTTAAAETAGPAEAGAAETSAPAAADASAEAASEPEAGPERASLSVVPNTADEDDEDEAESDDGAADTGDSGDSDDEAGQTVGEGAAARRRRRRR